MKRGTRKAIRARGVDDDVIGIWTHQELEHESEPPEELDSPHAGGL